MKVYVGMWDLLPKSWEGIMGLESATEKEIADEVKREIDEWANKPPYNPYNNKMGFYSIKEFEASFNYETKDPFTSDKYWIKIF